MVKTNAMRLLEKAHISYEASYYEVDEKNLAGIIVADKIKMPVEQVFKTLVAKGDRLGFMVACIPVNLTLDLKSLAKVTKDKKIEMIPVADLLQLTGYIRGGVSPIGMKKKYRTFIDKQALSYDIIAISAGIRGCQLKVNAADLIQFIDGEIVEIGI